MKLSQVRLILRPDALNGNDAHYTEKKRIVDVQ